MRDECRIYVIGIKMFVHSSNVDYHWYLYIFLKLGLFALIFVFQFISSFFGTRSPMLGFGFALKKRSG